MPVEKYRKLPAVVEAIKLEPSTLSEVTTWLDEGGTRFYIMYADNNNPTRISDSPSEGFTNVVLEIPTLEGTMRALAGDYIIRGVKGEFYPCKPSIFETTYEMVLDDESK